MRHISAVPWSAIVEVVLFLAGVSLILAAVWSFAPAAAMLLAGVLACGWAYLGSRDRARRGR